ncbi:hypothetical protein SUGI_0762870 [Cryptomeria japonica]|uniref:exocyst complex component EXO70B1 n=1 Tax=Cryptomeria japonica TaxID=3369 RepID=UPI002414775C|nr:exocyst complex component EXO70B1 [Cryptomeria japonica]GLJ37541.1 hypothetical protein SUGI_0762870 [Cryptomeria japonica]
MASDDGEEKVIATAHHIVKTLCTTDSMTEDMIHIFSKFDHRFSNMGENFSRRNAQSCTSEGLQEVLNLLEERIMRWDTPTSKSDRGQMMIWGGEGGESFLYLEAVDRVQRIIKSLSMVPDDEKDFVSLDRAQNILQQAMARLEEEFRVILEKYSESVDPDWLFDPISQPCLSTSINDDNASHTSAEDEGDEDDVPIAQPVADLNFTIDMLPLEVVLDLNDIAKHMVDAGYVAECCQVYGSIRRAFLEESIARLGFEKHIIGQVDKMQWENLEVNISRWIQVMKVAIHVFFRSESKLCERVFAGLPSVSDACFIELSRGTLLELLNFAEAVAVSRRSPEKLFKLLDMYETLRDLLSEIIAVFSGEACSEIRSEASAVWLQLSEAAWGMFVEFENAIQRDSAKIPVPGGALHPLTRYVMNYMRFTCDYKETLEQIMGDGRVEDPRMPDRSSSLSPDDCKNSGDELSPWSIQIIWIIELLDDNLDAKSKLYKDPSLSYLFLMNNGRYIVQKVKDSEIGCLVGDDWVRKHATKVRQYHKNYQRTAWGKVLSCLKDEGIYVSGNLSSTSSVSKAVLKERFKNFNDLFEQIHKVQSSWTVADDQLQTELRISIAEMVIPAYRSFLGRFRQFLENGKHSEKYIKYTPEDLEIYINELFDGISGSMGRSKALANN